MPRNMRIVSASVSPPVSRVLTAPASYHALHALFVPRLFVPTASVSAVLALSGHPLMAVETNSENCAPIAHATRVLPSALYPPVLA